MTTPLLLSGPNRPLRVLLTRPAEQSEHTAAWVTANGGQAYIYPCLVATPVKPAELKQALDAVCGVDAVVLTSVHAAEALWPVWPTRLRVPVFVLGEKTAQVLRQAGIAATVFADLADGAALARQVLAQVPCKRVLFPQAEQAHSQTAAVFEHAGTQVIPLVAYRTTPAPKETLLGAVSLLQKRSLDLAPFGSPRSAQHFLSVLGKQGPVLLETMQIGAIGQTTAAALRHLGVRVDVVSARPEFAGLIERLAARLQPRDGRGKRV